MAQISIREIKVNTPEYEQVWELREEVLRKPLGQSLKNDDLSGDAHDHILAAFKDNKVVGCVILHPKENSIMKLRQMAVHPSMQGTGVGTLIVKAAEAAALEYGFNKMDMHARVVALNFYKKLGYTVSSDVFTEVGIPHVVMEKSLMD